MIQDGDLQPLCRKEARRPPISARLIPYAVRRSARHSNSHKFLLAISRLRAGIRGGNRIEIHRGNNRRLDRSLPAGLSQLRQTSLNGSGDMAV